MQKTTNTPETPPTVARQRRIILVAVCILTLAIIVALAAFGIVHVPGWPKPQTNSANTSGNQAVAESGMKVVDDGLELSPDMVKRLGLTTISVKAGAGTRPLHLSGTINYDPDYSQRVHALFGGEVIEIAEIEENFRGVTERRRLSFNDPVRKGEILAVVWSRDLGQLKSALIDALVHLLFDEETLKRYETLYSSGGTSEAVVRAQRAQVSLDHNTASSAERTLNVARVPAEEIKAVKDEAQKVFERHGVHDTEKEKNWARVEVKSWIDGTLVEKNVNVGDTVDTSTDMFRIANMNKLAIWANAYEEDLPELNRLTLPYPWDVRLAAETKASGASGPGEVLKSPFLEKIGPAIDPNQHTALLIGRLDNPPPEKLRVGQFIDVAIKLPQPGNTVAVPVSALDEDGESSIIFVQPDPDKTYYQLRRVVVVQRLPDVVLVSSRLNETQRKNGLQELKPGDRIVVREAYLLRGALQDLKEKAKENHEDK